MKSLIVMDEDQAELERLRAIEQRTKECLEQKHGDRYGVLWERTFNFILTGEK
jgi:hypothetical protein